MCFNGFFGFWENLKIHQNPKIPIKPLVWLDFLDFGSISKSIKIQKFQQNQWFFWIFWILMDFYGFFGFFGFQAGQLASQPARRLSGWLAAGLDKPSIPQLSLASLAYHSPDR